MKKSFRPFYQWILAESTVLIKTSSGSRGGGQTDLVLPMVNYTET